MSMTRGKIEESITEARNFIAAAHAALERLDAENAARDLRFEHRYGMGIDEPHPPTGAAPHDYSYGSAETGSLRRRSMDLTRSLAELRK